MKAGIFRRSEPADENCKYSLSQLKRSRFRWKMIEDMRAKAHNGFNSSSFSWLQSKLRGGGEGEEVPMELGCVEPEHLYLICFVGVTIATIVLACLFAKSMMWFWPPNATSCLARKCLAHFRRATQCFSLVLYLPLLGGRVRN